MAGLVQIGEDERITITITDTAGDPFNLTELAGYGFILFYHNTSQIIEQFSRNTVTGYNTNMDVVNESTGIVILKLDRSKTAIAIPGERVDFIVLTQETDNDYNENRFNASTDAALLFHFSNSPVVPQIDIS